MPNSLPSGNTLNQGDSLTSTNGLYQAVMQTDGNWVLYAVSTSPWTVVWATYTQNQGTDPRRLVMQTDGNLVLYDINNIPLWNTGTANVGSFPWRVMLQNDRNLVLYDGNNIARWSSGTNI